MTSLPVRPRPMLCLLGLAVAVPLLAGCAGSQPRSRANAATVAACRSRADEVYLKQNRAEIYRSDRYVSEQRDSPFGSVGLPGITSAGLSGRYARDTLQDDCINSTGAAGGNRDSGTTSPATVLVPGP